MAYERRGWKGGAKATTVSGTLAAGATTIPCSDLSSWAGAATNGIGTATISRSIPGQATTDEEVITFSGIAGNSLTGVLRGQGGTADQMHASGATIEHSSQVRDFDEANAHIADTILDHHSQYARTDMSRVLTGSVKATNADHYFGANANGGTGARVHLFADTGTAAGVFAEGSGTNIDLTLRSKGIGLINFQAAGGAALGSFDSNANFTLGTATTGVMKFPNANTNSATATAGSNTLPANPRGFLTVNVAGVDVKMAYYNL